MPEAVCLLLEKGSSCCKARGIDFNACWEVGIPEGEDGGRGEGIVKSVKGLLLFCVPVPGGVFLGEVVEGLGQ